MNKPREVRYEDPPTNTAARMMRESEANHHRMRPWHQIFTGGFDPRKSNDQGWDSRCVDCGLAMQLSIVSEFVNEIGRTQRERCASASTLSPPEADRICEMCGEPLDPATGTCVKPNAIAIPAGLPESGRVRSVPPDPKREMQ